MARVQVSAMVAARAVGAACTAVTGARSPNLFAVVTSQWVVIAKSLPTVRYNQVSNYSHRRASLTNCHADYTDC